MRMLNNKLQTQIKNQYEELNNDYKESGNKNKYEFLKNNKITDLGLSTSCAIYLFVTDEEVSKLLRIKEKVNNFTNPLIALNEINDIINE